MDDENRINEISPAFNTLLEAIIVEDIDSNSTPDLAAATVAMTIATTPAGGGGGGGNVVAWGAPPAAPSSPRRSRILASIGGLESITSGDQLTPHVIMIYRGQNVVEKIMSFCGEGHKGVVILSANGIISSVTIRPSTSTRQIFYEGRFQLVSLTGAFIENENESDNGVTGGLNLTVSMALQDLSIVGGSIIGPLIAASTIKVVVGTFVPSFTNDRDFTPMPTPLRSLTMNFNSTSSNFDASPSYTNYNPTH